MWIPGRLGLLSPPLPWRKGSSKRCQQVSWLALRRERMTTLPVPDGTNSRRARRCSCGEWVGQALRRVSRRAASSPLRCPYWEWSCEEREVERSRLRRGHGLRFSENEVVVHASSTHLAGASQKRPIRSLYLVPTWPMYLHQAREKNQTNWRGWLGYHWR